MWECDDRQRDRYVKRESATRYSELKYCPECGNKLSEGVTRCWAAGCSFELPGSNKLRDQPMPTRKSDKLRELEMEYELATNGLTKGLPTTLAAMLSGLMTLLAAGVVLVMTARTLLSGNQLVMIFGILAAAIIIYFPFVFGRATRI